MKRVARHLIGLFVFVLAGCVPIQPAANAPPVEPTAGSWPTWVVTDVAAMRPPAPPDAEATQAELQTVQELIAQRDEAALQQIAYWDAGSPSYRWIEVAMSQFKAKPMNNLRVQCATALMNVAIYDAMVAAWEAKYHYNRARPAALAAGVDVLAQHTNSPSYPSEHAVAAGAAATILGYLYPDEAQLFMDMAAEAAQSRVLAGAHFPSDVEAGLALGQAVAEQVIARAQQDGSDAEWDGVMPTGAGYWTGDNPVEPMAGYWQTWVLASGDEVRPGPPPAYDSDQLAAELQEVKTFTRTWQSNQKVLYWHTLEGSVESWYNYAALRMFEQGLDANPPRAARTYAMMSVAHYDAVVACWDAKYTYWSIRPYQLDPEITVFFPTPHPSYPSGHSCVTSAIGEVLANQFPAYADAIHIRVEEAGDSRIWGGIHFRSDINAGRAIGLAVAQKVLERGQPMSE
jgi:membrane-associated phospholipid phosphatase